MNFCEMMPTQVTDLGWKAACPLLLGAYYISGAGHESSLIEAVLLPFPNYL